MQLDLRVGGLKAEVVFTGLGSGLREPTGARNVDDDVARTASTACAICQDCTADVDPNSDAEFTCIPVAHLNAFVETIEIPQNIQRSNPMFW